MTDAAVENVTLEERAVVVAAAAAAVLPSVQPLSPAGAQPGTPHVAAAFAGAAVAEIDGAVSGRIGLLVAADLVEALAASPLQGLDLAAATQPALDAAATALGGHARAARTIEPAAIADEFTGSFTAVPLIGAGIAAALLVPDDCLQASPAGGQPAAPAPAATPEAAPQPAAGGQTTTQTTTQAGRGIEMLHGVVMDVTVEIGRTRMTVRDLLALTPGTVLELDRAAGSPADLLVNGRLIARGEVVVVDEDFGLRVTEIVDDSSN